MRSYFSVPRNILELLVREGKDGAGKPERGGIIIGRYRGPHIEITEITLPGKDDQSSVFHFIRQDKSHQLTALNAWRRSNRTKTFVGEWHTHPAGRAVPSSIDKATWKKLTFAMNAPPIFVIGAPSEIGLFRGDLFLEKKRKKFRLTELDVEVVNDD